MEVNDVTLININIQSIMGTHIINKNPKKTFGPRFDPWGWPDNGTNGSGMKPSTSINWWGSIKFERNRERN